jgi:hypothetical protein
MVAELKAQPFFCMTNKKDKNTLQQRNYISCARKKISRQCYNPYLVNSMETVKMPSESAVFATVCHVLTTPWSDDMDVFGY